MARILAAADGAWARRDFPVAFVRAMAVNGPAMNAGPSGQTGTQAGGWESRPRPSKNRRQQEI